MLALALLAIPALIAAPASAAPTCQDRSGETVRCDVPQAMPVGWTVPPAQAEHYRLTHPGPPASYVLEVVLGIGLFFALIALLPRFDGRRDEDWE